MANYQFTFRNAKGDGAGAVQAPFDDDDGALGHAREMLSRHAAVEVARSGTRIAALKAPADFGRRPRFSAHSARQRKGIAAWRRGAR
ncbi:MAG: hypothetical protein ABUS57_14155 [Pseudomonadota bacterium]